MTDFALKFSVNGVVFEHILHIIGSNHVVDANKLDVFVIQSG